MLDRGLLPDFSRHRSSELGHATVKIGSPISAAALLLAPRIGQRFAASVTGAGAKGTWVHIPEPLVEGRVVTGYERLDAGDRVHVELAQTDVARDFIDFKRSK
jgi:exoribonuclease II